MALSQAEEALPALRQGGSRLGERKEEDETAARVTCVRGDLPPGPPHVHVSSNQGGGELRRQLMNAMTWQQRTACCSMALPVLL